MNQPGISLLLPTRGRPALVERFFRSLAETVSDPARVEVILYVDEDDVDSHRLDSDLFQVIRMVGPRVSMGSCNSACYHGSQGDIIFLVNDDMVFRTPGWDLRLLEVDALFPDKIYLAYGNDLYKKKGLCTFPILSRKTCRLLADPFPRQYLGAMIDSHLFDLFKRLQHAGFPRICYLDQVVFEHLHYKTGKADWDDTYGKRGRFSDDPIFISSIGSRKKAAHRLLQVLRSGEPEPPGYQEDSLDTIMPGTLFQAVATYTRLLLLDRELPLRWRTYLWIWYTARYMAGRGMLRPFIP